MLNIFDWLPTWSRGRKQVTKTATELYGSIVTQARLPVFYTHYGVLDAAEKRYEMIVLHIVLVLERLRASGEDGMDVGQELVEVFVRDLDGSIREMAIGDTKVPNNVKKAAAGLLDRDVLYRQAFDSDQGASRHGTLGGSDDMTLDALLQELIFGGQSSPEGAALGGYVREVRQKLSVWTLTDGIEQLAFVEPATNVNPQSGR